MILLINEALPHLQFIQRKPLLHSDPQNTYFFHIASTKIPFNYFNSIIDNYNDSPIQEIEIIIYAKITIVAKDNMISRFGWNKHKGLMILDPDQHSLSE